MKKSELKEALEFERANNTILVSFLAETLAELHSVTAGVEDPEIGEIIFNGPATIVKWDDGSKTVSKVRDGDEWDPMFGIIACIFRKLTRNRGHGVDDNEPLIAEMAEDIRSLDDIDRMTDFCLLTLDALTILRDSANIWYEKLGPEDASLDANDAAAEAVRDEHGGERKSRTEDMIAEREQIRQKIRDLVDAGEL